ncbi:unnamed protein product [Nyctereutes procyonoides]|uniref:(raccoon dog) hypothetical protein n=1 Tax=Nyctereutes procyonoides TaxID=34880 RepID=A0A811ZB90_NYCPR|nr:unnamed protein product [Nyctereutes procyonoides]
MNNYFQFLANESLCLPFQQPTFQGAAWGWPTFVSPPASLSLTLSDFMPSCHFPSAHRSAVFISMISKCHIRIMIVEITEIILRIKSQINVLEEVKRFKPLKSRNVSYSGVSNAHQLHHGKMVWLL